jgi:hypothetical protein
LPSEALLDPFHHLAEGSVAGVNYDPVSVVEGPRLTGLAGSVEAEQVTLQDSLIKERGVLAA